MKCSHCRCTLGSNSLACWWCWQAAREAERERKAAELLALAGNSVGVREEVRRWFAAAQANAGVIF